MSYVRSAQEIWAAVLGGFSSGLLAVCSGLADLTLNGATVDDSSSNGLGAEGMCRRWNSRTSDRGGSMVMNSEERRYMLAYSVIRAATTPRFLDAIRSLHAVAKGSRHTSKDVFPGNQILLQCRRHLTLKSYPEERLH
jgi:hypothetical protein